MKNYSKLGLFKSKGRIFKESSSLYRSPFQRDRDRIIHSASFRRLKHKTQVFVNTEGDHYRTRITHSLEVAQIARSIAKHLNLNDDLAETLSLAHDLGHTPFGHAGEYALNECMENFGGFDHNLQTLRIVMFLEHKYLNFKGLNLTTETLDGLIKHNGPVFDETMIDKIIGLKNLKNKFNFKKIVYITPLFILLVGLIFFIPRYENENKFEELLAIGNNKNSSSGLRLQIYGFALQKIAKAPICGYGWGDVKTALRNCYAGKKSEELLKNNYNSHNQYLSI